MAQPEPPSKVVGRERERVMWAWVHTLIGVEDGGLHFVGSLFFLFCLILIGGFFSPIDF